MFRSIFKRKFTLIGVVHLPPFPGYHNAKSVSELIEHALHDLHTLEKYNYDGILIENENDQPHNVLALPETISVMTRIVSEVVRASKNTTVGVEILLNDPKASLAVAKASGAKFIRTDYFVDRMARDEYGGEMHIDPEALLRYRKKIQAENVAILSDIQVKYARMLESKTLTESARLAKKMRADAIIVTGKITGDAPMIHDLIETRDAIKNYPLLIGSGLNIQNATSQVSYADGAIVGTGIMTNGIIDEKKAKELRLICI